LQNGVNEDALRFEIIASAQYRGAISIDISIDFNPAVAWNEKHSVTFK